MTQIDNLVDEITKNCTVDEAQQNEKSVLKTKNDSADYGEALVLKFANEVEEEESSNMGCIIDEATKNDAITNNKVGDAAIVEASDISEEENNIDNNIIDSEEEIRKTIDFLHPGEHFEIFALDSNGQRPSFGVFSNADSAIPVVLDKNDKGFNVFINLNPIVPWEAVTPHIDSEKLLTNKNGIRCANKTDVTRMSFLLVDVDPIRKNGVKNCSATNDEYMAATTVAQKVREFMTEELGVDDPLLANSGNGVHLIWRIDLPAEQKSEKLIRKCLLALANKFNSADAVIDTSISTQFHLTKLYGTTACKGVNTDDRPWCTSNIAELPTKSAHIALEKLKELAKLAPTDKATKDILDRSNSTAKKSKDEEKSEAEAFFNEFTRGCDTFLGEIDLREYIMLHADGDKRRTYVIDSNEFKDQLVYGYYKAKGDYLPCEAFEDSLKLLTLKTRIHGGKQKIYKRIAKVGDEIFYDLANDNNEIVRIAKEEITILKQSDLTLKHPVFVSNSGMTPQVMPNLDTEKQLHDLIYPYLNTADDSHKIMFIVSLISWFWVNQPRVIMLLNGAAGSGKSFTTALVQSLIDPSNQTASSLPNGKRDLTVSLATRYFSAFDNISTITQEVSDILCTACDTGTSSERKLFSNGDVYTSSYSSALLLNGIGSFIKKDDLLDRCVRIKNKLFVEKDRTSIVALRNSLKEDLPEIFGALLKVIQKTLQVLPTISAECYPKAPRMIDFYNLGIAISIALWGDGSIFTKAYFENIEDSFDDQIEEDVLANTLREYVRTWQADVIQSKITAADLYKELTSILEKSVVRVDTSAFPRNHATMSKKLHNLQTALANVGILLDFQKSNKNRYIIIKRDLTLNPSYPKARNVTVSRKPPSNLLNDEDED